MPACYRLGVVDFGRVVDAACRQRGAALMGVLNVTPDSFYDGGRFLEAKAAADHAARLAAQGADIIDIGGESSRPGAGGVPAPAQLGRIEPAVRAAVAEGRALVSVDTTSPEVADRMLGLGAHAVNDVSCLADVELARVAARHGAALIIMHSRGEHRTMTGFSQYPDDAYRDVVGETLAELSGARERALAAGVSSDRILLDPGIGFAKNAQHSFELVRRLAAFLETGARVVVGPSRKSFIGAADPAGASPEQRLGGTIAACLLCAQRGASVLRVHDVGAVSQALAVMRAAEPSATSGEAGRA